MALFAHPDDAELWAGATLAHHAAHARVTVAVPHRDAVRDAEAVASAAVLGADLRQLPVLDAPAVHALLMDTEPDIVITHPLRDVHPEHRAVAEAVLTALPEPVIATGLPSRLYTCDTYNSLTLDGPLRADTIVDATATFPTKIRALKAHASQPIAEHFGPMAEHLGRLWGARIGADYAEAFTALPILGRLPAATQL
ncbi:GlcNAc-PI de-N-acetylase [Kitasatospora acidiphila]|uniref:GlcNAc-PI de-N-acetylase n=1 Tax=Kitasatospora acidiphila TaxID=2567942 RepID=A0A540WFA9_9ACTN|nr:GlcNAc-PI de-N-acetylase [Kitasatospora acidiphila]